MEATEPTADDIARARRRAAARRNIGRHRAAAARYVPDYQEKHLTFTQRCERMAAQEAAEKAAKTAGRCPTCGQALPRQVLPKQGAGNGVAAAMAVGSVVAGIATGGMIADMHHDAHDV